MRNMNLPKLIAAGALAITAVCGVASAQQGTPPDGRVYTFHSRAQGGCPALDWHVVAGANNTLSGMIAWDDMKAMAHATGTLNMAAKTFQMTAHEVGGQIGPPLSMARSGRMVIWLPTSRDRTSTAPASWCRGSCSLRPTKSHLRRGGQLRPPRQCAWDQPLCHLGNTVGRFDH